MGDKRKSNLPALFILLGVVMVVVGVKDKFFPAKPGSAQHIASSAGSGFNAQKIKITKSGYVASTSKKLLDKATDYVAAGDQVAFRKLIESSDQIFILKSGIKVYVVDVNFTGTIKIRPVGKMLELWTVFEAVY